MNTTLGVVVTADEVCQAAASTLQTVLPDALASINDPAGRTLDPPSSYQQVPTREAVMDAEQTLPAVGVFSPGISDPPVRDENGVYTKTWRVTVVVYVRSDSYNDTQWAARTYGALIQAALAQNQTLGGIAAEVNPTGEAFDVVDAHASRTLAAAAVDVDVVVQAAFSGTPLNLNNPDDLVLTTSTDVEVLHPALA